MLSVFLTLLTYLFILMQANISIPLSSPSFVPVVLAGLKEFWIFCAIFCKILFWLLAVFGASGKPPKAELGVVVGRKLLMMLLTAFWKKFGACVDDDWLFWSPVTKTCGVEFAWLPVNWLRILLIKPGGRDGVATVVDVATMSLRLVDTCWAPKKIKFILDS